MKCIKGENGLKFIGLYSVFAKERRVDCLLTLVYGDNQSRSIVPHNSNKELKRNQYTLQSLSLFGGLKDDGKFQREKKNAFDMKKKVISFLFC